MQVIHFLLLQTSPVGVETIAQAVPSANVVTLYRMMNDFVEKGIVKQYELGHGHTDYELANRPHHHHAVCQSCGMIEDIFSCADTCGFEQAILKSSKKFDAIVRQSTTFFGTCTRCQGRL